MRIEISKTGIWFFKLAPLFCLAILIDALSGCSLIQPSRPVTHLASMQNQRTANAGFALSGLEEIDVLAKLDNRRLSDQIDLAIRSQAASDERYDIRKLNLSFSRQYIYLRALVDILDEDNNIISAALSGDVLLDFNVNRLSWFPRFNQLQINSQDFTFDNDSYTEATPELAQYLLESFNSDIVETLIRDGNNTIPLNLAPLGEVQVGAALPGFGNSTARHTQSLNGSFVVAGNALLIDSSITTVALDLVFIPALSTCPSDVSVSRANYASDIESREPAGIVTSMESSADIRYFYTEITGAKRPLTIIHYWFADGSPMSVEELAVGPSERWRTWSDKAAAHSDSDRLEVLVVDKESGCILLSKSLLPPEPANPITHVDRTEARRTFAAFKEEFLRRTTPFSIIADKPDIALIEIRRAFLSDVLEASLSGLSIDTEFDKSSLSTGRFSASLQAFNTEDIMCEQHSCPKAPVCKANISQCKRLRDTRDCSSCLFRNPLNNRCVNEAIDPLCMASRDRKNAGYEADRAVCIANAETTKRECDQLNIQAVRSCQIEAGFEDSVCETLKTSMKSLKPGLPLALVSAQTQSHGRLVVNFSNFRMEGDLDRLKLDMTVKPDIQLKGELNFSPANINRSIANCIAAWSAPFKSRFATTPALNNLLGNFEQGESALTAHWSGFGLTIDTNPSPLESVFVGNPQLLANCRIGLTVNKVGQAFAGDDAGFFRGQFELEIQPLPTKIHLAPVSMVFDDGIYSAEASLTTRNLRYDIKK